MSFQDPYVPGVPITGVQDVAAEEPFLLPLCLTYSQYHDLLGALYFARGLYANPASGGFGNIDHMLSVLIAQQYISDPSNAPCWPGDCLFCDKIQEILDTLPAGPEEFILKIAETLIECCVGISLPPPVTTFPDLCDLLSEELGSTANLSQLITTAENCGIQVQMDFTAESVTLAPGADATATYDQQNNKFIFGIPQGIQGPQGLQGEQGPAGLTGPAGADGVCPGCANEATETERSGLTEENLCAAAERAATWFQSRMLDILDIAAAVSAFSEFTASVVTTPLEFVPILNGLDDATVDNAFLAVNAAGLALAAEVNTTTEEDLQCAIYCDLLTRFEGASGNVSWGEYAEKIVTIADTVYPSIASRGLALLTARLIGNDEIARQLYAYSFDEQSACATLCDCDDGVWCYTWDFTVASGGWTTTTDNGQYSAGVGFVERGDNPGEIQIRRTFTGTTITEFEVELSQAFAGVSPGWFLEYFDGGVQQYSQSGNPAGQTIINVTSTSDPGIDEIKFYLDTRFGDSTLQSWPGAIVRVTLRGTGTNPFGTDNCP